MDKTRAKGGKKAATVAIASNCFLTILNIAVGITCGSYALVAEGAHTLSDVITSVIAYLGFKIGQRPPNEDYPLGFGRAEAIAGLIIVIFLVMVGYEVIETAIEKLLNPALITVPDIFAALMAIFGIFMNLAVSTYIIKIGKEIQSPAIVADGKHQKTDIYSSIAILIGIVVANSGYPILDPIVGLIIGILILKVAYDIGKENLEYILGKSPSEKYIRRIERIANKTPGAQEAHNIKVDNFGAYSIVGLHIKVDGDMPVKEAHKIAHLTGKNIREKMPNVRYVSVHTCPLELEYDHDQEFKK